MFSELRSRDVHAAAERIRGVVRRTDLRRSPVLSELTGTDVYLKLECEQVTGSFKLRGAYNALSSLDPERRARGVIAASAGNHGLGIAYAARELGIPATLYIPSTAPAVKRDGIVALGARVDATSPDYDHALARAMTHAEQEKVPFVSATGDTDVIAGQGTAALEILEELPTVRTVILPVGGAGLLAGFGSLLRAEAPTVRIFGVQGTRSDAMARALEAGKLVPVSHEGTLADGLSGDIDDLALDYWKLGVRHIVALRGDPPEPGTRFAPHPGGYRDASELVAGLKRVAPFDISVAAYPEVHPDSSSRAFDLENLKRKVDAGANRAITQFFFSADCFLRFRDEAAACGIDVEIVPGILPVSNVAQTLRFAESCGATIPDWLNALFEGLDDLPAARQLIAATVAAELCGQLYADGVRCFHFYTLNRAELTYAICHLLGVRAQRQAA